MESTVLTKKYSHNLKVESYFIWWECLGCKPRRQHLSGSEKIAQRRQDGKSGYMQGCDKRSTQSEHQRLGIKIKNLVFSVGEMQASGLTEFTPFLSTLWSQSCFLVPLASCIPPLPQQSLWGLAASAGSQGSLIPWWLRR